ncbi:DNA-binding transcriptional regulator, LysR family [Anaerosphaera aminiphila DSM 21120]|uniref:DNA-binding transcriptional regulator, LysR family n=1 Tax=Anaerosphaera aminiphila DSM 21120 TaxID=1120995 RepID=A0A1M5Q6R2_9FIRM|nr:LysR family transcriptional regulator [Anaerosphaera aminiphila]SHH09662.1 DNA-binding transcriptional regulator, LysR family [Anaerosphaera aminiphila DSM 21120]
MEFREFEYIITVAKYQSFTKAAEKLYVSQPTISQTITNVEKKLNVKLFDRSCFPIKLTYSGERYVEIAKEIISLKDNLLKELSDINNGEQGKIRLGTPTERAAHVIPLVIGDFKREYPKYEVVVIENSSKNLRKMLVEKEVDILLLPQKEQEIDLDIEDEFIYEEKLLLAAKKGLVKSEDLIGNYKNVFPVKNINKYPLIMLKKGHAMRLTLDVLLKDIKDQKIYMETDSHTYSALLASKGLGITIVPTRTRELLRNNNELDYFLIEKTNGEFLNRKIYAIYRKDYYMSKAEKKFLNIIKTKLKVIENISIL